MMKKNQKVGISLMILSVLIATIYSSSYAHLFSLLDFTFGMVVLFWGDKEVK